MTITVAVVIPYFQRDQGILSAALKSVFAQEIPPDVHLKVYVVDDASPLSPDIEINTLITPVNVEVMVLRRENGGPGAARNTALEALANTATDYVAFLDSDDQWEPTHIQDGLGALNGSTSFYFCNHTRTGRVGSWFTSEVSAVNSWKCDEENVLFAQNVLDTLEISGILAFKAMLVEYLSQTSTVIFDFQVHPNLRFEESLRNAGEDSFFWLELAAASMRVAVSTKTNVHCGTGVNIYFGSFDWNSNKSVARYGYLTLFGLHILDSFRLEAADIAVVKGRLKANTNAYAYLLVRQLARGKVPDFKLLTALARKSPRRVALMPLHFWRGLRSRKMAAELW